MYTLHIHMLVLHTYFASLGDKVTVIANGRARIFFLCLLWYILVPLFPPPPSAAVQGRAQKKGCAAIVDRRSIYYLRVES